MNKIYISKETDPYFNVASEYQLLTEADDNTSLFLWQNSSCVVFGRNQNIYAECNTEYLKKHNILPVRRFSGGGAVYQDIGNLNFTFVAKEKNADTKKYLSVIKNAINTFEVDCNFSGRNDLLCNGKKFSGHAYYTEDDNNMYHGTIMINVDIDMLSKALKPSYLKLESKGIDSVKSRVVNLSDINSSITTNAVREALIKSFVEVFGESEDIKYIDKENFQAPLFRKINTDKWIYDEAPQYSINFEKKLSIGIVTISVDVENGLIKQIKIQTDSLSVINFAECEKLLIGRKFDKDYIFAYIEKFITKLINNSL